MNKVYRPPNPAFVDLAAFLSSSAAPASPYPICIKNSQIDGPHVLYNTEQLTRADYRSGLRKNFHPEIFTHSDIVEVWDFSPHNLQVLAQEGVHNTRHVPLSIWPEYQARILAHVWRTQFDSDVAFVGWLSRRRQAVVSELVGLGISVDVISDLFGDARDARIAKSRILLNIHFAEDYRLFEQLRCFAWFGTPLRVVSEDSLDNDDRCLNVPYGQLVPSILSLLGRSGHQS